MLALSSQHNIFKQKTVLLSCISQYHRIFWSNKCSSGVQKINGPSKLRKVPKTFHWGGQNFCLHTCLRLSRCCSCCCRFHWLCWISSSTDGVVGGGSIVIGAGTSATSLSGGLQSTANHKNTQMQKKHDFYCTQRQTSACQCIQIWWIWVNKRTGKRYWKKLTLVWMDVPRAKPFRSEKHAGNHSCWFVPLWFSMSCDSRMKNSGVRKH